MCPERSGALRFFARVLRTGAPRRSRYASRRARAGCLCGDGRDFRLYFDVKINCITFAGVSVSRSRHGRSGNQKGNGWDARTVPAAVCSSAARRDCGAALFDHWSCGSGRCRLRSESEDLPVRNPAHSACGEREGAKQGLSRFRSFAVCPASADAGPECRPRTGRTM